MLYEQPRTRKRLTFILQILFCLTYICSTAQESKKSIPINISGYAEVYYNYDFGNPSDDYRPRFICSYNRHNEININLAYLKAAWNTERLRANVALMTGTYANANLADEPGVSKNIFEANIGIKISKKSNLWIDAGVFPSHIGFESARGMDCGSLTRSMLADNSPYYESGVKITYQDKSEKWLASGLILNGWQRIQREAGNSLPAFGHQITYHPHKTITINSSSYIGSEGTDEERRMRYYHNLYMKFQFYREFEITLGFDIGLQQRKKGRSQHDVWFSPVLLYSFKPAKNLKLCTRIEYFDDTEAVIVESMSPYGFQTLGYSINFDYQIQPNMLWRIEGRGFLGRDKIFFMNDKPSNQNYSLTTALIVAFD
ncbi:MAG: porin [Chitinophagales bacterium]|nr:porin [Chitinophagales bacterium]